MFGFILGFVCLAALGVRCAKRRHGCGGHGGRCGGEGRCAHGGPGRGWGPQRWLSRKLDATPAQETVIGEAFADVTRTMDGMRDEARKTREDVATAMRAEPFDQATLDSAFARQTVQIQEMQRVFGEALAKVHAALDDRQRKLVGTLLERLGWMDGAMGGPPPWVRGHRCGGHGPYRA
jgi:Spy/CpxP family protein refolding chaperone